MKSALFREKSIFSVLAFSFSFLLFGCPAEKQDPPDDPDIREKDQTSFVSASESGSYGGTRDDMDGAAEPAPADESNGDADERTVEEGDIYRVLSGNLIVNLNSYRGLQIIDFTDPSDPEIIGRAQVTGYPVEMYVHGDYAYVLMNDWRGYYGSRFTPDFETLTGGLVLSVNIANPTDPQVVQHEHVPGYIQTSRLVHGGGQAALYVAAGEWQYFRDEDGNWQSNLETYVRSFEVTGGVIEQRSEIDLGGFVSDIQATPEALLVARNERWWRTGQTPSKVSVIDISSPDGTMVEGSDVEVAGFVFTQFNMDLYKGVLRVVSGSRWGSRPTNYIQTFDASDISNLVLIDQEEFGQGEDLYATLFLGNKAFFVTYWQVDPFHAFEITDEGIATEMSEYIVSGWNDYFRPVFNQTRLIGIGKNDEEGNQQAVSLYDITDLTNPDPMIARAEVDMRWSWSEAQWDHRAFSVLQNAVDVTTEDGVQETGMVLLPFSGYDRDEDTGRWSFMSAVQIFTFSEDTLTRRGVMQHPSRVRRSFLASDDAVANLSETDLAFFDHQDPDNPAPLGSVELAPDYADYFRFGDYALRRKDEGNPWWYYYDDDDTSTTIMEVLDADENPDMAEPLATFEINRRATVHQVGDLLVSIWNREDENSNGNNDWYYGDYIPTMSVHDLSNPLQPELLTTIDITDAVESTHYWSSWETHAAGEGIIFVDRTYHRQSIGTYERCYLSIHGDYSCDDTTGICVWYEGYLNCQRDDNNELICDGDVRRCEYEIDNDSFECENVDVEDVDDWEDYVRCHEYNEYRHWNELSIKPVDLSNPSQPVIRDAIELDEEDNGVGVLAEGSDVYISFNRPYEIEGDSRRYVRWFYSQADLSDYANPVLHDPVNVPGRLIAVEGNYVFTRDSLYNNRNVETAVAKCEVINGLAHLRGIKRFIGRNVGTVLLDGAGNLLISHGPAWWWDGPVVIGDTEDNDESGNLYSLTILNAQNDDFEIQSTTLVDNWARLTDAQPGRALFRVPGGILVMNLDDATQPYPQSYFAVNGWPRSIGIFDENLIIPAGRYGIYSFHMNDFNLLPIVQ